MFCSYPSAIVRRMAIETLSEALAAGWRVHARCLDSEVDNTRSRAKCHYRAELSPETLVWTRGRNMSLSALRERMMCPRCGTGASISSSIRRRSRSAPPRGPPECAISIRSPRARRRSATGAMRGDVGNMPPLPGVFPDYFAPIVRERRGGPRARHGALGHAVAV